ncbi:MAG: hypothetical protein HZB38_08360, partial [Planctomycetes bacterium]|nr:hypothetical protein [Planctomycetota bacterium]
MRTPNTVPMRASFQLRRPSRALCVLAAVGLASATAWGEVVSFSGKAEASITEHVAAASSRSDSASLAYPGSSLPLQVLAQLSTDASQYPSAGAVAAQFADPTTDPANPEEFAINLTLNSVAADVAYDGTAIAEETREIVFSAGELGLAAAAGVPQTVRGRLAIDGALTIIAADTTRDLTGSSVKLTVTVEQATESSTETVFTGAVELAGRPDADVAVLAEGSFPTSRLILSNLAGLGADFGVFHVVIIPNITIDYNYTATVGTPLKLTARVRIDAGAHDLDHVLAVDQRGQAPRARSARGSSRR